MGDALNPFGGQDAIDEENKLKWEKRNKKREDRIRKRGKMPTLKIRGWIGSENEIVDRLNEVINWLNKNPDK